MNNRQDTNGQVIDLAALARPAQQVVRLFDRADTGHPPEPGALNTALQALGQIPRPSGQLGTDITMLTNGGDGHTKDDVLAAIERLRRISIIQPAPTATPAKRRRRAKHYDSEGQLQLPGLNPPKEAS